MTVEASSLISAMTASQLRAVLFHVLGGKQAEKAVEALARVSRDDDLDLADGPLEVITEYLRGTAVDDTEQADLAIAIYEALIDAGHLPGINAQRYCTDAVDAEVEVD